MILYNFRGYKIYKSDDGEFYYADNNESVRSTWMYRGCGHCGMQNTKDGHDACLGELENVINACCGHGDTNQAYVQFDNGELLYKKEAVDFFKNKDTEDKRLDKFISKLCDIDSSSVHEDGINILIDLYNDGDLNWIWRFAKQIKDAYQDREDDLEALHKVLEFYADENNYRKDFEGDSNIDLDKGYRAQMSLWWRDDND